MKSRFRPQLTYANVMSSIAVFAVLGGGVAWAHGKIGTADLRNSAVTTPKLANNAVATSKLRQKAVRPSKLGNSAVKTRAIASGAVGGSELATIVERPGTISVVNGSQNNTTVDCEPGETVVAGGAEWDNLSTGVRLQQSHRVGNGWNAAGANDSGATRELTVKAYCLQ